MVVHFKMKRLLHRPATDKLCDKVTKRVKIELPDCVIVQQLRGLQLVSSAILTKIPQSVGLACARRMPLQIQVAGPLPTSKLFFES